MEGDGFEPSKSATADLQSAPFGHSGTYAYEVGAGEGNRTRNLLITNQLLCQLSYTSIRFVCVPISKEIMATRKGLEPSTSSVTGWHSNQLNYSAIYDGSYRARTCDPLLVRQMLSQLSYAPKSVFSRLCIVAVVSRRRVI